MTRAVKSVTTYRGRDPRDFTLFAFGGNGGIHAVSLARALGIRTIVVPPGAGVFSALGLLYADVETGSSTACLRRIATVDQATLEAQFQGLEHDIAAELDQPRSHVTMTRAADLRYAGQAFELTLPFEAGADLAQLQERFEAQHQRSYGYRLPGVAVEIVTLRANGRLQRTGEAIQPRHAIPASAAPSRRRVWFGPSLGAHDTPVTGRAALTAGPTSGPMIIEEYEGTTVVPPDCTAELDSQNNIIIRVGA
jgi:N-methylhydantoinase A